jgi:inorganic pyrophosphatase
MSTERRLRDFDQLAQVFRPHPWHGISIGKDAPQVVTAYIEIVPTDTVKYEIDKATGYLKVDRPQKFSNVCPTPYGFLPQTYCGERVGAFAGERAGRAGIVGDGDPMDICVLTEKSITHGDLLMDAIPIGGLRLIDRNEADDKILAVLKDDAAYGAWRDVSDCPAALIKRLVHYFTTYKQEPGVTKPTCEVTHVYGREEAHEAIRHSRADYDARFGHLRES